MPLNPLIALQGQPVQIATPDPIQQAAGLAHLAAYQDQALLRRAHLAQLMREQENDAAFRAHFGQARQTAAPLSALATPAAPVSQDLTEVVTRQEPGVAPTTTTRVPGPVAPGSTGPAASATPAAPSAAQSPYGAMFSEDDWRVAVRLKGAAGLRTLEMMQKLRRGDPEAAQKMTENALKGYELLGQAYGGVRDQATLDQTRAYLQNIHPQLAQMMPATYTPEAIQQARGNLMSEKDRIEAMAKAQDIRLKGQKSDYGYGNEVDAAIYGRYGEQLPPGARPTPAMVAQARKDVEEGKIRVNASQGENAAQIAASSKPLEGAAAKEVADINALLALHHDATGLYKQEYVGPIRGRLGSVGELTGNITTDEVQLRRAVQDMKDTLLRARSGAAITQQEYSRLSELVPNLTDQPNVFEAKMQGFARSLEQLRGAKLQVATTGRGALRQGAGTPRPLAAPYTDADLDAAAREYQQATGKSTTKDAIEQYWKKLGRERAQ